MTAIYDLRRQRTNEPGASDFDEEYQEGDDFVVVSPRLKKRLTRMIDEGVLNINENDYSATGELAS